MPPPTVASTIDEVLDASVVWSRHRGLTYATVVLKATFRLVQGGFASITAPEQIIEHDVARPSGSIHRASEAAPFMANAAVLLHGHARPLLGAPASPFNVRLGVSTRAGIVDKTLRVFPDGGPVSLLYEEAPSSFENPVGTPRPRVLDPARTTRPASFGPIAPTWHPRVQFGVAPERSQHDVIDLPDAIDARFWNPAPIDQQPPKLASEMTLLLDGLDVEHHRFKTALPRLEVAVRCALDGGAPFAVATTLDMLVIDADRRVASVVFRGGFACGEASQLHVDAKANGAFARPPEGAFRREGAGPITAKTLARRGPPPVAGRKTVAPHDDEPASLPFASAAHAETVRGQASIPATPFDRAFAPQPVAPAVGPASASEGSTLVNSPALTAEAIARGAPRTQASPITADMPAAPRKAKTPVVVPTPIMILRSTLPSQKDGSVDEPVALRSANPTAPSTESPPVEAKGIEAAAGAIETTAHVESPEAVAEVLTDPGRRLVVERMRDGAALYDLDLRGADLHELDLSGRALSGSKLDGANLEGANLREARLARVSFVGSNLDGANFEGADLEGAKLNRATAYETRFDRATLDRVDAADLVAVGASFKGAKAKGAAFTNANLERSNFDEALFEEASLVKARLPGASMLAVRLVRANCVQAIFDGATLDDADLSGSDFSRAGLTDVKARRATAKKTTFERASLVRVNFENANLAGATLDKASCDEANFASANLEGATLTQIAGSSAKFRSANLAKALLRQARLDGATLSGAVLTDAQLTRADLSGAKLDGANLGRADGRTAKCVGADFTGAKLDEADFRDADLSDARFSQTDRATFKSKGAKTKGIIE